MIWRMSELTTSASPDKLNDRAGAPDRQERPRVVSVDATRGVIMALMALDHARLYFTNARFDPVAVEDTNLAYFATRWSTHLCAPGFFFLAGLSVHLAAQPGLAARSSATLLAARGAWLVALELTVIGLAWSFTPGWSWFGVIWSLGTSMICLALVRSFPKPLLAVASGAFLLLHNVLPMASLIPSQSLYTLLYGAGPVAGRWVLFPILPWLALMILGFASGPWLTPSGRLRPWRTAAAGLIGGLGFLLCRVTGFGEPSEGGARHWDNAMKAFMSFMNVEKYPPSTQYVLVTLGLILLLLAGAEVIGRRRGSVRRLLEPLRVYGAVPLFFYLVHIYLIHGLAIVVARASGWPTAGLIWHGQPDLTPPHGYGLGLTGVYAVWIVILLLLLPACWWFSIRKRSSGRLWTKFL